MVSFILPSLQKHTYLLLSSLALALCCQTCLSINLMCKSMLSEAEEIVPSHPISRICFSLQADGLVRASRCLSCGDLPQLGSGQRAPLSCFARHLPPGLGHAHCPTTRCSPGSCTRAKAQDTRCPLLSSWQGGGPASHPICMPVCRSSEPLRHHDRRAQSPILCSWLLGSAPPASGRSRERASRFPSALYLSCRSAFASLLPGVRGKLAGEAGALQAGPWGGCL